MSWSRGYSTEGVGEAPNLHILDVFYKHVYQRKHQWSSGMMNRCHRFDRGSIPR